MNDTDLAWAAGFIDGEGCISIRTSGNYYGCVLTVVQKFPSPLLKLQTMFGGSIAARDKGAAYQWRITSNPKVIEVLTLLYPYLLVKKPQAKLVLEDFTLASRNKNLFEMNLLLNKISLMKRVP